MAVLFLKNGSSVWEAAEARRQCADLCAPWERATGQEQGGEVRAELDSHCRGRQGREVGHSHGTGWATCFSSDIMGPGKSSPGSTSHTFCAHSVPPNARGDGAPPPPWAAGSGRILIGAYQSDPEPMHQLFPCFTPPQKDLSLQTDI